MSKLLKAECFVLDMDGTIYLGDRLLPGAKELLSFFYRNNIHYFFFTNNSSKSPKAYIEKLSSLGLGEFSEQQIITSGDVTADYIKSTFGQKPNIYLLGTQSLKEHFESKGIGCNDSKAPCCVVAGFDTTFSFAKASQATNLLRKNIPFLATNIDAVCPLDGGRVLPDCASICAMLSHATGRIPKFLGKPSTETAVYISGKAGVPPESIAVVGDRLYTDMHLAIDNGMCSVAVLSGEMTMEDIKNHPQKPDYVFAGVYELLKELNNKGDLKQ